MKKLQLIECGIVVVGLLLLYNLLTQIFSLIFQVFYVSGLGEPANKLLVRQVLIIAGITVITYTLLRFSRSIAGIFVRDSDTSQFAIRAGRRSLLQIALIIAGIVQLFEAVPGIVNYLGESGKPWWSEAGDPFGNDTLFKVERVGFYISIIIALFALFIIFCSGPISRLFFMNNNDDDENDLQLTKE